MQGVAEGRGKTVEELDGYSQKATIQDADDALETGMVDELLYKDQVIDKLREKMGVEDEGESQLHRPWEIQERTSSKRR